MKLPSHWNWAFFHESRQSNSLIKISSRKVVSGHNNNIAVLLCYQYCDDGLAEAVALTFLKFSQNSQENTCARVSFFKKVAGLVLCYRCFPRNFTKFLRTPFYKTPQGDCFWLCEEMFLPYIVYFKILILEQG